MEPIHSGIDVFLTLLGFGVFIWLILAGLAMIVKANKRDK